jgi:hypothetical protein
VSTDLLEPATQTEVILLPTSETQIAELKTAYMQLVTNGPEDRTAFDLVHAAEQRCVKLRTGTVKAVKDMCEPLKKQIDKYKKDGDRLIELLAPIEAHLKGQKKLVADEEARREQERLDELFDLRKRRWLEATGNAPDFEGFPESMLRNLNEADFEAEIQRLTEKTRLEREATIKRIEAETLAAKQRADEAAALKKQADDLAAKQAAFDLQQREAKAALELQAQQQREAQQRIDAETRRLDGERRAKEEADKPVAGGNATSVGCAADPPAAAPSDDGPPLGFFKEPAQPSIPVNADYDRGWMDGARHVAHFTKMLPTAIEAIVDNRQKSAGYKP